MFGSFQIEITRGINFLNGNGVTVVSVNDAGLNTAKFHAYGSVWDVPVCG